MMLKPVHDKIADALEPLVGPVLARVTVEVEARRLSKEPTDLTYDDIVPMSVAIERHLVNFVGRTVAEAAATKVREVL